MFRDDMNGNEKIQCTTLDGNEDQSKIWYCGILYLIRIFPPLSIHLYIAMHTHKQTNHIQTHKSVSVYIYLCVGRSLLCGHFSLNYLYVDVFGVRRAWAIHLHRSVNREMLWMLSEIGCGPWNVAEKKNKKERKIE